MRILTLLACPLLAALGLGDVAVAQEKSARPAMRTQINRAIERGVEALLESQTRGFTWGPTGRTIDTSLTALAVYTLLQTGADRDSAPIEGAISKIRRSKHQHTYGIACALMALGAHDANGHRKKIQSLADKLVETQRFGSWGYPRGDDLSNTQFAILGLWAAARAGADVPAEVWVRAAGALPNFANPMGGFSYRRGKANPSGSMTAAGLSSVAICRAMAAKSSAGSMIVEDLARELDLIEAQGLEWLADNFSGTKNPPRGNAWIAYFLYGTERVGALFNTSQFGTHDWYAEGALYFLAGQHADGSWGRGTDSISGTCFALLFLRRATTKLVKTPVSGPTSLQESDALERRDRRDLGRNRSQVSAPQVEASSEGSDHGAPLACDGRLDTFWEAEGSDPRPRITIVFAKPHEADTVLISYPRTPESVRASTCRVLINGTDAYEVPMPPASERKGRLRLPAPITITRIEVSVLGTGSGSGSTGRVGIGEVEIQMRPEL